MSEQQTLRVANVEVGVRVTTQGKAINRIMFSLPNDEENTYIAEEAVEVPQGLQPTSAFRKGQLATFTIANKGLGGKLDWIRFVHAAGQPVVNQPVDTQYLIVAQVAFKGAIDIVASTGGTREEVLPIAEQFAQDIYHIANNLSQSFR